MKLKTEKQQRKINETKSVLCKVNTIDKPRQTDFKRKYKLPITDIKETDCKCIKNTIGNIRNTLCPTFNNLVKMNQFLEIS